MNPNPLTDRPYSLQVLVFSLVVAAFSTVYITQPVLPVLTTEFKVSEFYASLSVSAVILGMALANLPWGRLADRTPVRPIILLGGLVITLCGLFSASTASLWLLVLARFVQGLFIPTLSTCVVVYLGRSLPLERLNVIMGTYVSATVAGGLSGRLLGGWIHPPLHWRYAFVTTSIILFTVTLAALRWLPPETRKIEVSEKEPGFISLLTRPGVRHILLVPFGAFFVFSSIFNYLPFYLAAPPFNASTQIITLMYLLSFGDSDRPGGGQPQQPLRQWRHYVGWHPGLRPGHHHQPDSIHVGRGPKLGRSLHRLFRHSRRGRGAAEPQTHHEPGPGQLPVYPVLLSGRLHRHHLKRPGL